MNPQEIFKNSSILFEAVGDERKFILPMLKLLKEIYQIKCVVLVRFSQDKKFFLDSGLFDAAYSFSEIIDNYVYDNKDVIIKAKNIETKYNTVFNYNLCDRRLFFTGCTSFPYTLNETGTSYEDWIRQFVSIYYGIESIFNKHKITIAINGRRVVTDIAKSLGLHVRSMGYSFLHDRMLWRDSLKMNRTWLKKAHKKMELANKNISSDILEPPPFHMNVRRNFFRGIQFYKLINSTIYIIVRTIYWKLRKHDKVNKFGFSLNRHIRLYWRRRKIFKYLIKKSITTQNLIKSKKTFVFMALQMEPEVLLSTQTPEFYDQISIIHQVAKELPAGTYLAVKDHVPAIGYRDLSFYRMLDTMPNVILIDPSEYAIPLIKKTKVVVSLLGRSAFEAAALGVPVLAFSPYLPFDYLEHVHICTDMLNVRSELHTLLKYNTQDRIRFAKEGERLLAAVEATTIDPHNYDKEEGLGKALINKLVESFNY
tara:strand:- start:4100 stop:5542 length:1443 start_codon:yes stop_codon:yes gene_type:complete